ncbi:MAG: Cna B-type domain-containing protein, partial [Lachnospiraceae bacterium]
VSGASSGGEGETTDNKYSFVVYRNRSWGEDPLTNVSKEEGTVAHISFKDAYGNNYTSLGTIKVNDIEITPDKTVIDDNAASYSFDVTISEDTVIDISFNNRDNWSDYFVEYDLPSISTDPSVPESPAENDGEPYGEEIEITYSDGWTHTFTDLPLTDTDTDGNTVNYYYYVEEVSVPNYSTSYTNNGGIQSGTITVTNKATDTPTYELPETGGPGTRIAYTLGSILILLASAAFLYIKKRNDGKKGGLA